MNGSDPVLFFPIGQSERDQNINPSLPGHTLALGMRHFDYLCGSNEFIYISGRSGGL